MVVASSCRTNNNSLREYIQYGHFGPENRQYSEVSICSHLHYLLSASLTLDKTVWGRPWPEPVQVDTVHQPKIRKLKLGQMQRQSPIHCANSPRNMQPAHCSSLWYFGFPSNGLERSSFHCRFLSLVFSIWNFFGGTGIWWAGRVSPCRSVASSTWTTTQPASTSSTAAASTTTTANVSRYPLSFDRRRNEIDHNKRDQKQTRKSKGDIWLLSQAFTTIIEMNWNER